VHGYVAPTDHGWYQFLRARPEIAEVNFWRPGASSFRALNPGEPFFFKLKAPHNAIGGFGLFARFQTLPVWQAWDVFGQANGTADVHELLTRLDRLSASTGVRRHLTNPIGCIAVTEPVFFPPDEWVAAPTDWERSIVQARDTNSQQARADASGSNASNAPPPRPTAGPLRHSVTIAQVDRCSSPPAWDSRASVSPCSTPTTDSAR
jgi:hypothetical protein